MTDYKQSLLDRAELNKEQEIKTCLTADDIKEVLNPLIEIIKKTSFTSDYKASTNEAFGLLISKFFEWDGLAILKATIYALEDSNFHSEIETIEKLISKIEKV